MVAIDGCTCEKIKNLNDPFGTMNMDTMQKELDYEIFVMEILEMDHCSKIIRRRLTMLRREKKRIRVLFDLYVQRGKK